jgi:hypothetical protein
MSGKSIIFGAARNASAFSSLSSRFLLTHHRNDFDFSHCGHGDRQAIALNSLPHVWLLLRIELAANGVCAVPHARSQGMIVPHTLDFIL